MRPSPKHLCSCQLQTYLNHPPSVLGEQFKQREQLLVSAAVEITLSGKVLNRVSFKVLANSRVLGAR